VVLTGARMNMPWNGRFASRRPSTSKGASNDSTCIGPMRCVLAKIDALPTCEPQPFRAILTATPPRTSWPPFFAFSTADESRIAPAHVPHTGFFLRNCAMGSSSPASRASSAIVVDSAGAHGQLRLPPREGGM
jgi:hypothetical protein